MFNVFVNKHLIWSRTTELIHLHLMRLKGVSYFLLCVFIHIFLVAQEVTEKAPGENIKSVQFSGIKKKEAFPLIELGEELILDFDDLNADEADYYYRVKYYNHDWTPSQLFSNEYIEGYDNLRIDNYNTSFNTLQSYTHYQLKLPNENINFKISGNYILEIYSSEDHLVFSRRFCIFEPLASIQTAVYRPQNMDRFMSHQSIHFTITLNKGIIRNPKENLHVLIIQNRQWGQNIKGLSPQYHKGQTLEYRYEFPSQFEGGNEYLFFDTKDLRVSTPNISFINRADLYESYLNIDVPRFYSNYTYSPDINGGFEIRNIMRPGDPNSEADYSYVYFSLAADYKLNEDEIFIYGGFNNYNFSDENKMYYNPALEVYEGILILKQGFYNYKYVVKQNNSIKINVLSGSHSLTENDYLILAYYRFIGGQYDALIGFGSANSFELQN